MNIYTGGKKYTGEKKHLLITLNKDDLNHLVCRDVKAGNILLNNEGHAKLADFGVAGQLTDTMAKRNTVIGTPFWMAPEVIQEIGYDCVADIWSLGITALEMGEGKPPYGDIHPMRAIFMIPTKPPPTFRDASKWSPKFTEFVGRYKICSKFDTSSVKRVNYIEAVKGWFKKRVEIRCLVKSPEKRATASELLNCDFISSAGTSQVKHLINNKYVLFL